MDKDKFKEWLLEREIPEDLAQTIANSAEEQNQMFPEGPGSQDFYECLEELIDDMKDRPGNDVVHVLLWMHMSTMAILDSIN